MYNISKYNNYIHYNFPIQVLNYKIGLSFNLEGCMKKILYTLILLFISTIFNILIASDEYRLYLSIYNSFYFMLIPMLQIIFILVYISLKNLNTKKAIKSILFISFAILYIYLISFIFLLVSAHTFIIGILYLLFLYFFNKYILKLTDLYLAPIIIYISSFYIATYILLFLYLF